MRIQQFIVDLDNQHAVYRPGDEIKGRVILRLAKSIRIRGLRLNIVGESFSRWEFGKKSTSNASSSYIYKSYEKYIDYKQTLLGKEEHDSKAKNVGLQKGDHVFEFSYRLPVGEDAGVDLPTSIEGAYGYVRYCIRVVVDRPMKRNQWTLKPITVLKTMDLNQEPTAQETPKVSNTSKVRSKSCVCRTGAHNLSLDLERTGFCPGESIVVNAKCENGTSRKILRTSVDLLQVINYLGNKKPLIGSVQSKTRRTMKVVQSVRGEGCGGHSIVHWNNVPLIVPPVPPSRLDGCNIIDVQYLIRFTAYLKNGKRLFCETGVLVGTEPLTSSYAAYYGEGISCVVDRSTSIPAELNAKSEQTGDAEDGNAAETKQDVQSGTGKVDTIDEQFFPVYTNVACPPASYEECVYGGATLTNDEYTMGQTVFVPLYRVYHTLRHQSIAIQAYGRASIVVEDMSPYKPIGVPVSVQVSEVHLPTVGIQEEDEEYFDDDHSDPLAYRESTGENEDSEVTSSPLPNGEYIPERPLEPIMFEVHHSGESQYASAAESPQMQVYPANGTENDHFVAPNAKVLNGVEYHQESSIDTPVREDDNNSYPATAIVSIENENAVEYSDSEAEQEPEPVAVPPEAVNDDAGREEVFLDNHVITVQEPEEPRPLFSTEQVLIAYEKEPYSVDEDIPEIEEVENVAEEMKVQESCPEPPVTAPPEIEESLVPSEPKEENESAQSVELDSNGLPIGAMIPLTNSNESFNSDNTTDDQPASEVFQEEPAPVAPVMYTYNQQIESPITQESKVTIENVRIIQNASMMETLEIITTDVGTELNSEPYINGEGESYEPTLQIAPRDYQLPSQESGRYSESDAAMYEDFRADDIEGQHDRLPNGTASNTLEELSVDTNAPTVDLDSTEAEYHSGSSNCAEFMVNSLTPDYYLADSDNAANSALTPELPSPSFPEPIEENEPCEEPEEGVFEEQEEEAEPEETKIDDEEEDESYVASDKDEITEVYQPKEEEPEEEEDLQRNAEVERQSSSGSSSLVEPLNYVETAENIAEAAIREATVQVSKDEVVRTSVHFNVEEEPNTGTDSPSIAPEKLLYVDDVNTTESSDKTSYDNVQFDDLLDYEENTRSDQVEDLNSSPTENGTLESTELSPPPLVHLDSVTNDYDNEPEPEKVDLGVFLPPPPEPPVQHHEPQFQEVIANISLEPSMNSSHQQFGQIPSDQLYNVPTQNTVESSSEDEDDEEGLSAIEEEPSLTTQDGEESTPPPIPDRSLIPDFPAPPIPLRAPAPEPDSYLPDPTYSGTVDDYLANKFQDDPFPVPIMEPLSPITEKTFDGETTADEASPSVFSDNTSKQFELMTSDCGSYDVNESESGMQAIGDVNQTFNDTFPEIDDDDAAEDMQKHEYNMQSDDHSNENLESLVPPEREPITPEDDIYISYGPGVSGTLVSEHAENDDYDIDDLIGPGPESAPPPIDRSQKPTDQSPSHNSGSSPFHAQNEVAQHSTNDEGTSDSFDDDGRERGLSMVQGSYPDDEEVEGRVGGMGPSTNGEVEEEAEESAGERGESSDDVEERDCFGGVDSCDRLEELGRKDDDREGREESVSDGKLGSETPQPPVDHLDHLHLMDSTPSTHPRLVEEDFGPGEGTPI